METNKVEESNNNRLPVWVLIVGFGSIINFVFCIWNLSYPAHGRLVYFWFTKLYTYLLFPSFILFPLGFFAVALWFSSLTKREWANVLLKIIGGVLAAFVFLPALSFTFFTTTLRVIGMVKQEDQTYYLVDYYNDRAIDIAFCTSNKFGFSGHCENIAWSGNDTDPVMYIDNETNLITVKSEKPSFIWINSVPPQCNNISNEIDGATYVGGCFD
ncbi:MAG: hypothetical protein K8R16_05130 [Anaerolineales bacterium]|nr:hypothetical protein [Anaerolineales bacterium]